METLQIEEGNFTRISNTILDKLVNIPLLGTEYALCLFVLRKTYGYNKTEDAISLTQFGKAIGRSRVSIVKGLKNLQLVNILILVKNGNSRTSSNIWKFNKYYDTWKLVNTPKLVKSRDTTSKLKGLQLVKTPIHTKDNTKDNIQKTISRKQVACPLGDRHKECIAFLDELAKQKNLSHGWINFGKQLGFLHKMLRTGYSFEVIKGIALDLDDSKFMWDKWDLATIASQIEKQGREVIING